MDIIILAAISFFIFYKLSKQLGKIDEEEKNNLQEVINKKKEQAIEIQNRIIDAAKKQIADVIESQAKIEAEITSHLDNKDRETFQEIIKRCKITADFFLNGLKSTFEMVIDGFAKGNSEILKPLLSEKIYQGFEAAINQRKSENKTLITNLIALEGAKIFALQINGDFAFVTVSFVSKQINYITDANNQIVEGRKDEIAKISDSWTFKKDLNSTDPTWVVVATSNS